MYFLLVFVLFSTNSLAGGSCKNRKKDQCVNGWKYKAEARVWNFGVPKINTAKSCPGYDNGLAFASVSNNCAWQHSQNYYGSWAFDGSVFKNKAICSRGEAYSDLFISASSYYDFDKDNAYEESKIKTSETIFNSNSVEIKSVEGYLKQSGDGMFSYFEVIMWVPSNDSDSIITEEKTFYHGKVELKSGKLIVTGDFKEDDFYVKREADGSCLVELNNLSVFAEIPSWVNSEDDIEVVGINEGGQDEEEFFDKFKDADKLFNISPNPASDVVNIKMLEKSEDTESNFFNIEIYDLFGNSVGDYIYRIENEKNAITTINLAELNLIKGTYQIAIYSNDMFVIQKLICQ